MADGVGQQEHVDQSVSMLLGAGRRWDVRRGRREPELEVGVPEIVLQDLSDSWRLWDVTPDGRFLWGGRPEPPAPEVVFVTNWFEELRALAPARQ